MDTSHALPSPKIFSKSHGILNGNGRFALQPLTEESESEASGITILSPVPKHPTTPLLSSDYDAELHLEGEAFHNLDNKMMKATMTDVQKAIEQLGHDGVRDDGDGARRFSFASTRDGASTENSDTGFDLSDFDGIGINGNDGEGWRKAARQKLAAKAKRAVEEARNLESMMGHNKNRRVIAPPTEVEPENDAQDLTRSSRFRRNHPYVPEEDENVGTDGEVTVAADGTRYSLSTDVFVPPNDETDIPTATKPSLLASQSPVPAEPLPEEPEEKPRPIEKDVYSNSIAPDLTRSSYFHRNHPYVPGEDGHVGTDGEATAAADGTRHLLSADVFVPSNDESDIPTATKPSFSDPQTPVPTEPLPKKSEEKPPTPEKDILPSPIPPPTTTLHNIQQTLKKSTTPVREISNGLSAPASVGDTNSKHNDIISSSSAPGMLASALQVHQQPNLNSTSTFAEPASIPVSTTVQGRNETPPVEWSVKEVVDWLKSKGFDKNICDKFIGKCIIHFCLTQNKT